RGGGCGLSRRLGRRFLRRTAAKAAFSSLWSRGTQLAPFIERERARIAILRDLRVLHAVGDVRPVAAVEHLNARVREIEDDAVCILLLLRANELERTGQLDRVRIVFLDGDELLRPILNVRTEAADRDFDRLSA